MAINLSSIFISFSSSVLDLSSQEHHQQHREKSAIHRHSFHGPDFAVCLQVHAIDNPPPSSSSLVQCPAAPFNQFGKTQTPYASTTHTSVHPLVGFETVSLYPPPLPASPPTLHLHEHYYFLYRQRPSIVLKTWSSAARIN